ncbi:hypothetical protein ACFUJY_32665 [Streptomyces sp. NPDC057249]|uniref:hypothetical protein n=1 Tax=Streptomyces sp. NPDC057249 TaxID=3346067 RepID=UPI003639621E
MRRSELLSDAPAVVAMQVGSFLGGHALKWGKHKRIRTRKVLRNFHCRACDAQRTFVSGDELSCPGLGDNQISIDATLQCVECRASVEIWFLIGSSGDISGAANEYPWATEELGWHVENISEITGGGIA